MWETKRTKTVVINILLILFIIVIVGGLVMGMRYVSRISATQDAQLSEIYSQQKQEQNAARVESVNAIQEEYEKDMRTVAQYVPGVVCWGDETTAGTTAHACFTVSFHFHQFHPFDGFQNFPRRIIHFIVTTEIT